MGFERNKKIVFIAILILVLISIGFFATNQFLSGNCVLDFLLKR